MCGTLVFFFIENTYRIFWKRFRNASRRVIENGRVTVLWRRRVPSVENSDDNNTSDIGTAAAVVVVVIIHARGVRTRGRDWSTPRQPPPPSSAPRLARVQSDSRASLARCSEKIRSASRRRNQTKYNQIRSTSACLLRSACRRLRTVFWAASARRVVNAENVEKHQWVLPTVFH